jgi:predicted nucleic acid-binding protein
MIVVSDAGPLHYLILIGQIELLPNLYGQVVVPVTVVNELQHLHTPATVRAWIGAPPTWLDIRKTDVDPKGTPLGVGELAAITLAEQLHADLMLMDDLDGRIEAERRHLKVIGTLGVLRDAAFQRLIDLPQVLDQLQQTNFFISPTVLRSLLAGLRKPEA